MRIVERPAIVWPTFGFVVLGLPFLGYALANIPHPQAGSLSIVQILVVGGWGSWVTALWCRQLVRCLFPDYLEARGDNLLVRVWGSRIGRSDFRLARTAIREVILEPWQAGLQHLLIECWSGTRFRVFAYLPAERAALLKTRITHWAHGLQV